VRGLKTQCMGLSAPTKGDITQAACEAQCCQSAAAGAGGPHVADGKGHKGPCDTWQWAPMAEMKRNFPTQAANCYVGVLGVDEYKCTPADTMERYVDVHFVRGEGCMGLERGGWTFVLVVLGVCVAYFGGGIAYNRRRSSARGWRALPHAPVWMEVAALVQDGRHALAPDSPCA
jgi:hypothetical protein